MWPLLYKKPAKNNPHKSNSQYIDCDLSAKFSKIKGCSFVGSCQKSPNGKFIIAWRQQGRTPNEMGSYLFASSNKIKFTKKMKRPLHGAAANNGNFILCSTPDPQKLNSSLYSFNSNGKLILKHGFTAILYNCGISECGRHAITQCCNSDTEDSGLLTLFDLKEKKVIWKLRPRPGWADSYKFDLDKKCISLIYRDYGALRYDFEGNFLDKEKWEIKRIKYARSFDLLWIAEEKLETLKNKHPTNEGKQEIISLLERAFDTSSEKEFKTKAMAYRRMGEVHEVFGETDQTIKYFELALSIDPKVGIQRRFNSLKRTQT